MGLGDAFGQPGAGKGGHGGYSHAEESSGHGGKKDRPGMHDNSDAVQLDIDESLMRTGPDGLSESGAWLTAAAGSLRRPQGARDPMWASAGLVGRRGSRQLATERRACSADWTRSCHAKTESLPKYFLALQRPRSALRSTAGTSSRRRPIPSGSSSSSTVRASACERQAVPVAGCGCGTRQPGLTGPGCS